MTRKPHVIVGVSGSIAAYKAADVVSKLVQAGMDVTVTMTPHATKFVAPMTFQALTRRRVLVDQYDPETVLDPTHVTLTDDADLVLIAPATANVIGKIAHGIADDMLTSLMLAVRCPVLIAPAMNDRMLANPFVKANVARLKGAGYAFIDPEAGRLACGTVGVGRLADPEKIVARVKKMLK